MNYFTAAEDASKNHVQQGYIKDILVAVKEQMDDAYDFANAIASCRKVAKILYEEYLNYDSQNKEGFGVMVDAADLDWEGFEDEDSPGNVFMLPGHLEHRRGYMGTDMQLKNMDYILAEMEAQ